MANCLLCAHVFHAYASVFLFGVKVRAGKGAAWFTVCSLSASATQFALALHTDGANALSLRSVGPSALHVTGHTVADAAAALGGAPACPSGENLRSLGACWGGGGQRSNESEEIRGRR
jgi:hypothetical protein